MRERGTGVDVMAIVESVRHRMERRTAGRPRTPPFDPQLASDVVSLRHTADQYHLPMVSTRGVAASTMGAVRRGLRRLLLPWITRQSTYNAINVRAMESLRDQMELIAYHQALSMEELLDSQVRALEAVCNRLDDLPPELTDDVATMRERLGTVDAEGSLLKTEMASLSASVALATATLTEVRTELDSIRTALARAEHGIADAARTTLEELSVTREAALRSLRERLSRTERGLRRILDSSTHDTPAISPRPRAIPQTAPQFDYFGFEERFRGSEDEIRERQSGYLRYFTSAPVVDLGCGRGEFLELLRNAGIEAHGVDVNRDMILCCRDKGLEAVQSDLMSWLGEQEEGSLGGIFCAQVIEHMHADDVMRLVCLCQRMLRPGGCVLLETVNPASLWALANFYLDFTHVRPLHPEAMRFLLESNQFERVDVLYSSPAPFTDQVPEVPDTPHFAEAAGLFNRAIRHLNAFVYGAADYAVVGYRPG